MRGAFITLEGTEGVGKTTNREFIVDFLKDKGIDVVVTREPGGTPMAEQMRSLLLDKREEKVQPYTEVMLTFAARLQHVENVIKPALLDGKWVVSDRFTDSTYAYQGFGRGVSMGNIAALERMTIGSFKPDLTFFLDVDPETGMSRVNKRVVTDRMESEKIDFYKLVRNGYEYLQSKHSERIRRIDASMQLQDVQAQIKMHLDELIKIANNRTWSVGDNI